MSEMTDFIQTTGICLLAINAIAMVYVIRDLQRRILKGQERNLHETHNEATFMFSEPGDGMQSRCSLTPDDEGDTVNWGSTLSLKASDLSLE